MICKYLRTTSRFGGALCCKLYDMEHSSRLCVFDEDYSGMCICPRNHRNMSKRCV